MRALLLNLTESLRTKLEFTGIASDSSLRSIAIAFTSAIIQVCNTTLPTDYFIEVAPNIFMDFLIKILDCSFRFRLFLYSFFFFICNLISSHSIFLAACFSFKNFPLNRGSSNVARIRLIFGICPCFHWWNGLPRIFVTHPLLFGYHCHCLFLKDKRAVLQQLVSHNWFFQYQSLLSVVEWISGLNHSSPF